MVKLKSSAIPVCSIGHKDVTHDCQTPLRAKGSPNVIAGKRPWSRMGDINTTHIFGPKCKSSHAMPIAQGSSTVIVNGRGGGRIGDKVSACTMVAQGWNNIRAGN